MHNNKEEILYLMLSNSKLGFKEIRKLFYENNKENENSLSYYNFYYLYHRMQKKIFDNFFEMNLSIRESFKNNEKINKKYATFLYEYIINSKNASEIQEILKDKNIKITKTTIYCYTAKIKKMICNYVYNNLEKYIDYLSKNKKCDEVIFVDSKKVKIEDIKNNISQVLEITNNTIDELQEDTQITDKNNMDKKLFNAKVELIQEEEIKREKSKKRKEKKPVLTPLYDKDEVIGDRDYSNIVIEELKEIKDDERRVPLYPNDYKHPYKEELWYTLEDIEMKKEDRDYYLEEISRLLNPTKYWDEKYPFFCLNIFGAITPIKEFSYCREAKKGSGTRGYISHVVRDMVDKLNKKTKIDKKILNYEIDEVIKEWEYPFEKVKLYFNTGIFEHCAMPIKKLKSIEEEEAMSREEYKRYWDRIDPSALLDESLSQEEKNRRQEIAIKKLNLSSPFEYAKEINLKKTYAKDGLETTTYYNKSKENFKKAVEYNNNIAISKLEFIFSKINKKYNTDFNIEDSIGLMKVIKKINEKR